MMDLKTQAVQKAEKLRQELEEIIDGTFTIICNSGSPGSYQINLYGKQIAQILGHVNSDDYSVTIWDHKGQRTIYSSGYDTVTEKEMMTAMRTFCQPRKAQQISLFGLPVDL